MKYRNDTWGGPGQSGGDVGRNGWEAERDEFVRLPRLPAILTDVQAGWLLGFTTEAVGVLVGNGLLQPLGQAGKDDSKRFPRVYIERLAGDRDWLDQATNAIYQSRKSNS